jgi:NTP pyrophosphatase (non-canonical NTP hydrolase)
MNWKEYLPLAEKTLSDQFNCQEEFYQKILHAVIGSLTEIEEILQNYNLEFNLITDLDKQGSIAEETADIFWYLSILFRELQIDDYNTQLANEFEELTESYQPFILLMTYLKVNLKFLDSLKKKIYYNKPIDKENIVKYTKDMYSLLVHYCVMHGADFESILDKNIAKLKSRYGDKFSSEKAIDRDLEAERKILEN